MPVTGSRICPFSKQLAQFLDSTQVLLPRLLPPISQGATAIHEFTTHYPRSATYWEKVLTRGIVVSVLDDLSRRLPLKAPLVQEFLDVTRNSDDKTALQRVLLRAVSDLQGGFTGARVADHIAARASDPHFGLRDLAKELNLSYSYASTVVRSETGRCFKRFLTESRLSKAVTLLLDSHLSVKEVAASVGFNSTAQLDRYFNRSYGVTPIQLRSTALAREAFATESKDPRILRKKR